MWDEEGNHNGVIDEPFMTFGEETCLPSKSMIQEQKEAKEKQRQGDKKKLALQEESYPSHPSHHLRKRNSKTRNEHDSAKEDEKKEEEGDNDLFEASQGDDDIILNIIPNLWMNVFWVWWRQTKIKTKEHVAKMLANVKEMVLPYEKTVRRKRQKILRKILRSTVPVSERYAELKMKMKKQKMAELRRQQHQQQQERDEEEENEKENINYHPFMSSLASVTNGRVQPMKMKEENTPRQSKKGEKLNEIVEAPKSNTKLEDLEKELNFLREQIASLVSGHMMPAIQEQPKSSLSIPQFGAPPPPPPPPALNKPIPTRKSSYRASVALPPHDPNPSSVLRESKPPLNMTDVLKDISNVKLRKTRIISPGGTMKPRSPHKVNASQLSAADVIALALKKKFAKVNGGESVTNGPQSPIGKITSISPEKSVRGEDLK